MSTVYSVELLVSGRTQRSDTTSASEAFSIAREVPDVVVSKYDSDGWLIDEAHFSPKHPLWTREKFLKWARSRGRTASRHVRQKR